MSVKVFYKDGKEETLDNYSTCSFENEGFVTFEKEGDEVDCVFIASRLINRIE